MLKSSCRYRLVGGRQSVWLEPDNDWRLATAVGEQGKRRSCSFVEVFPIELAVSVDIASQPCEPARSDPRVESVRSPRRPAMTRRRELDAPGPAACSTIPPLLGRSGSQRKRRRAPTWRRIRTRSRTPAGSRSRFSRDNKMRREDSLPARRCDAGCVAACAAGRRAGGAAERQAPAPRTWGVRHRLRGAPVW
jgi:hypothetical protein